MLREMPQSSIRRREIYLTMKSIFRVNIRVRSSRTCRLWQKWSRPAWPAVASIDPSESGSRGALCLITDITEVTRLREQVALKRNLESLGEMSAGLAHE